MLLASRGLRKKTCISWRLLWWLNHVPTKRHIGGRQVTTNYITQKPLCFCPGLDLYLDSYRLHHKPLSGWRVSSSTKAQSEDKRKDSAFCPTKNSDLGKEEKGSMWRLPKLALGKMIKQGTHFNRAKEEHSADGHGYPSHHRGYHLFLYNKNRKKQCVPRKALISWETLPNLRHSAIWWGHTLHSQGPLA